MQVYERGIGKERLGIIVVGPVRREENALVLGDQQVGLTQGAAALGAAGGSAGGAGT
ncbi:MAG TPA: hypothetical protein VG815_21615 [Chloroflexota bacterium]|nr:hypothetical protein [Chloroflexota bacterium]